MKFCPIKFCPFFRFSRIPIKIEKNPIHLIDQTLSYLTIFRHNKNGQRFIHDCKLQLLIAIFGPEKKLIVSFSHVANNMPHQTIWVIQIFKIPRPIGANKIRFLTKEFLFTSILNCQANSIIEYSQT